MNPWRRKLRLAAVAGVVAVGLIAAGCSSSGGTSSSGPSGTAVTGGTATVALPAGVTYNYIFPFYPVTYASVYNLQFQYLFVRPLYIFGNNTSSSVAINYPLSTASAPVYSNGGKTVVVNMKGWKWSNGESVDANSLIFFLNMAEAEKANWYGYSPGLLPDNLVVLQGHRDRPGDASSSTGPTPPSGSPTTSWASSSRCRSPGTSPA